MKNNINNMPELLSPCSSLDSLKAAVSGGCDSVYFGGKSFNARVNSQNFTDDELLEAIDFCHLYGVKAYITVNTIYKNSELKDVYAFLQKMYKAGADAFIMQDIGAAAFALKEFKDISIHASTQMTVSDLESALYMKEAGFKRVVLSRELSLPQIKHINENCGIETEVFVHGALCVCYSGQCLMSGMIGGRSGNRGTCAQPCRKGYSLLKDEQEIESGFLLSPMDMNTLEILPEIIDSGVSSLKIEGRMKSPEYVGLSTRLYNAQLERIKVGKPFVSSDETYKITQIFNRGGGFNKSYYQSHSGKDMMSTETSKSTGNFIGTVLEYDKSQKLCTIEIIKDLHPADGIEIWTDTAPHTGTNLNYFYKAFSKIRLTIGGNIKPGNKVYLSYDKQLSDELKAQNSRIERKLPINCRVKAKTGEPLELTLYYSNIDVTETGNEVQKAMKAPITTDKLTGQITKTGDTTFSINIDSIDADDDIFIPVSEINAVRRNAVEAFKTAYLQSFKREYTDSAVALLNIDSDIHSDNNNEEASHEKQICIYTDIDHIEASFINGVDVIYAEVCQPFMDKLDYFIQKASELNIKLYGALPAFRDSSEYIELLEKSEISGYLIRTYGQLRLLRHTKKEKTTDINFNVANNLSANYLNKFASCVTISPELNFREINDINSQNSEIIIYGRLTLMQTRQCPVGLYHGNKQSGKFCSLKGHNGINYALKDEKGVSFPVISDCESCIAKILNSQTVFLLNKSMDVKNSIPSSLRIVLTTESQEECRDLIASHINAFKYNLPYDGILPQNITNGHYFRGVL